jgi:hypothetical protein
MEDSMSIDKMSALSAWQYSEVPEEEDHKEKLTQLVVAIIPNALLSWEGDLGKPEDKAEFARETVDLAEAVMLEINKRNTPQEK